MNGRVPGEYPRILIRSTPLFVLMMVLGFSGCSLIRIGPAVEILELDMNENARKNLDAIRAMQADRYRRSPVIVSAEPGAPSQGPLSSHEPGPLPVAPDSPLQMMPDSPLPIAPASQTDSLPKRPWNPSAVAPSSLPERSVPAYTIPAPVGPGQAGPPRCIPDGLGGQRCLTH